MSVFLSAPANKYSTVYGNGGVGGAGASVEENPAPDNDDGCVEVGKLATGSSCLGGGSASEKCEESALESGTWTVNLGPSTW